MKMQKLLAHGFSFFFYLPLHLKPLTPTSRIKLQLHGCENKDINTTEMSLNEYLFFLVFTSYSADN